MLGLYVDETSDDTAYMVAGLISTIRDWDRFTAEWNRILATDPFMPYWHQSDAWANRPPFDRLTKTQKSQREWLLTRAVANAKPKALATVLYESDYREHLKGRIDPPPSDCQAGRRRRKLIRRLGDAPYPMLHMTWVKLVRDFLDRHDLSDPVMLVFERADKRHDASAVQTLNDILALDEENGLKDPFHTISHASGKNPESRPLEAIDMYAWAFRRQLTGKNQHQVMQYLLSENPVTCYTLTPEMIRLHVEALNRPYDPHDFWSRETRG